MTKSKVKTSIKGKSSHKGGQKGGNMDTCPEGVICMESMIPWIIILFILIIGGMFIYFKYYDRQYPMNTHNMNNNNTVSSSNTIPIVNQGINENIPLSKVEDPRTQQSEKFGDKVFINNQPYPQPLPPSPRQYIVNKEQERLTNPLLPPERSYVLANAGMPAFVDTPTRGYSGGFQQIGLLIKNDGKDENNNNNNIMPLFGRPTISNRDRWCYYTTSDKYHSLKIPLSIDGRQCNDDQGCKELYDNDAVNVPGYNGEFKATIYGYDSPKYLPQVW